MNKLAIKNTFTVLLACLLIIAMMIVQGLNSEVMGIVFWIGIIISVCAVLYIVYQTFVLSNRLNKTQKELNDVKTRLKQVAKTPEEKTESKEEISETKE